MAATIKVPAIFSATDKFSSVLSQMGKNITKFSSKANAGFQRVDRKINKTFSKAKNAVGGFGLMLGGAALLGALGSAISITADYEQSNANLAAVLGTSVQKTQALQESSKLLGATTSFTASEVVQLQTEYAKLGFVEKDILKVTKSTLSLAAATKTELGQAAAQVGAALKTFKMDASQAARVSDVFAASTSKSALDMEFLSTAMSTVSPVANAFGFGVEEVTSLLGSLANAGFDASSAGTATKNILLNLSDSNSKLSKSLKEPIKDLPSLMRGLKGLSKSGIDLAGALELTDKRTVAAFSTFLSGTDATKKLHESLKNSSGFAEQMAETQLNTLTGRVTILKSAYEGFILSLDDGNGVFSTALKKIVEVATEMLSMASGTAKSTECMTAAELKIRQYAETGMSFLNALKWITGAYIGFRAVMIATTAYAWLANVAMGAQGAVTGKASIAIGQNTIAVKFHNIVDVILDHMHFLEIRQKKNYDSDFRLVELETTRP